MYYQPFSILHPLPQLDPSPSPYRQFSVLKHGVSVMVLVSLRNRRFWGLEFEGATKTKRGHCRCFTFYTLHLKTTEVLIFSAILCSKPCTIRFEENSQNAQLPSRVKSRFVFLFLLSSDLAWLRVCERFRRSKVDESIQITIFLRAVSCHLFNELSLKLLVYLSIIILEYMS